MIQGRSQPDSAPEAGEPLKRPEGSYAADGVHRQLGEPAGAVQSEAPSQSPGEQSRRHEDELPELDAGIEGEERRLPDGTDLLLSGRGGRSLRTRS